MDYFAKKITLAAKISLFHCNGNPLQYSCLENPMDREAWWTTVQGVTKSWTQLNDFHFDMYACMLSHFSRVLFCVTPWTAAHQAPMSTGFSRQEHFDIKCDIYCW